MKAIKSFIPVSLIFLVCLQGGGQNLNNLNPAPCFTTWTAYPHGSSIAEIPADDFFSRFRISSFYAQSFLQYDGTDNYTITSAHLKKMKCSKPRPLAISNSTEPVSFIYISDRLNPESYKR